MALFSNPVNWRRWDEIDPEIFPQRVKNAFPKKIDRPETVNFTEPPAKLLERLYSLHTHRSYKKVVHGRELFGKLNPEIASQKCSRLRELLDKMLELAREAE